MYVKILFFEVIKLTLAIICFYRSKIAEIDDDDFAKNVDEGKLTFPGVNLTWGNFNLEIADHFFIILLISISVQIL